MFVYLTANNVNTDISVAGLFSTREEAQNHMRSDAEDCAADLNLERDDISQYEDAVIGPMSWHIYTGEKDGSGDFYYGCIQELPDQTVAEKLERKPADVVVVVEDGMVQDIFASTHAGTVNAEVIDLDTQDPDEREKREDEAGRLRTNVEFKCIY